MIIRCASRVHGQGGCLLRDELVYIGRCGLAIARDSGRQVLWVDLAQIGVCKAVVVAESRGSRDGKDSGRFS